MSNYPIWWDTTITIYNKYIDPLTDVVTWYRTVVPKCFWKYTGGKVHIGETVLETEDIICRIPESNNFKPKKDWNTLPSEEQLKFFTIGQDDIIVQGEVDDVINEYLSGHRSTDLLDKYGTLQMCMQVKQFALNIGIGRNNPHYFVKGI